jgi:hypothetical protein
MLNRLIHPLPLATSRRAYSFFSSKPGGGRYFNSAKPHKVSPATATANASGKSKARTEETPSPTPPSTPDEASSQALGHEDPPSASTSSPVFSSESSPASSPRLPLHPNFSGHTYPLHQFFSFHRPLLLLPLATSTLFDTPATSFDEATSPPPVESVMQTLPYGEHSETPAEADADTARQLARALAMNHVGGWIDWEETLARLGDTESLQTLQSTIPVCGVDMDSTKRKKRKKMSKHK